MKKTETNKRIANRKKLLLVVRWPVGGIRTFMRYVYRRFDPELYHYTIIGPDIPELDVLGVDLEGLDLEIIKVSVDPSSFELFLAVARLLIIGRYDLIHSQGFTSAVTAALPAFLLRIPHIATSHDILSTSQFQGRAGRIKKMVMGIALSLVDVIHSVSHDAQTNLLEFFPILDKKKGRCVVLLNGIEIDRFVNALPRNLREELNVGDDIYLIGFLGRFMAQKGFVYLVDAIERLKLSGNSSKKPLVLAFGEGGFIREEKALLAARGLEEHFLFLPFTSNVASVIKGLDLVVMPSLWEACALLPMETLVAGTPLIASDCIGLREVVRGTPTYMVPIKDSQSLEVGIKFFMETDRRLHFANFALEAAKRYDVTNSSTKLQKLIDEILM